jgi:hypothetical protein
VVLALTVFGRVNLFELKVGCVLLVADMARDSPLGSPVVSRRNDLNNLNNTYHIDPGLHEQAFQQQILQVSHGYTVQNLHLVNTGRFTRQWNGKRAQYSRVYRYVCL